MEENGDSLDDTRQNRSKEIERTRKEKEKKEERKETADGGSRR
jgi:hypothetical protein